MNENLSILLVETGDDVGRLLRQLLTELHGAALDRVSDYETALTMVGEKRHDVCLVDYALGNKTGLDLLQQAISAGSTAPMILMTEIHDRRVDMAAIAAGAADYLIKRELTVSLLERSIRYAVERKRVEEALRRSEESLARALRIAHLGNWDWNVNTNEMFWSDETYRILGLYPRESGATYEGFLLGVHGDDRAFVNRAVNEAIYMGNPLSIEHRIILPHGVERIVHQQGEVILDTQGKPLRIVGTIQDITERRRVEDALRQMEEKFSKAFHASPDWIVMSSASDGRYMEVNDAFLTLTGYSRSEVIGKTSTALGIWADPVERVSMLKLLDEYGTVRNLEVKFRMKAGDIRSMLWSADVIEYNGEACLIAVARDVTEQRELENELVKSQAELFRKHEELTSLFALVETGKREWETSMDRIGDMVIVADAEGKIRRCNRAFQSFCDLPYEKLVGADWVELLRERELIAETIDEGSIDLYHEPTGRWFTLTPYPFNGGSETVPVGTVVTIHDTTEIKEYRARLERMNQELRDSTTAAPQMTVRQ